MNLYPAKTKIKIFKHKILKVTFDEFSGLRPSQYHHK